MINISSGWAINYPVGGFYLYCCNAGEWISQPAQMWSKEFAPFLMMMSFIVVHVWNFWFVVPTGKVCQWLPVYNVVLWFMAMVSLFMDDILTINCMSQWGRFEWNACEQCCSWIHSRVHSGGAAHHCRGLGSPSCQHQHFKKFICHTRITCQYQKFKNIICTCTMIMIFYISHCFQRRCRNRPRRCRSQPVHFHKPSPGILVLVLV